MFLLDRITKFYFRNLVAYQEHDKVIRRRMDKALADHFELAVSNQEEADELLNDVLQYETRLYQAGTVETMAIWGGNRGFEDAVKNPAASELATTIRLAFGEGDIIDTLNDEYDPDILELMNLPEKEDESRILKGERLKRIIRLLDELIYARFEKLHSTGEDLYRSYRRRVEEGQKEDIQLRLRYLKEDFAVIRNQYSSVQEISELLVKKLGLMGECVAQIAYQESGGKNDDLMNALSQFYVNAGVLLQFWSNDVQKLWSDLENKETNPIITYAIWKHPTFERLDKPMLSKILSENPQILDQLMKPYIDAMNRSLTIIRKHRFDGRTHQGFKMIINNSAKKEKARLFNSL